MKLNKLVVIPMDSIAALIKSGTNYKNIARRYNLQGVFGKVYILSPYGETQTIENIHYIKAE